MENAGRPHVAVIGAGVVGVAAAIWLRRAGARVTLIDREGPAAGASFGNAGVLAAGSVVPVPVPGLIWKAPGMLLDPMKPLFLRWPYLPKLAPFLMRYLANGRDAPVRRISAALAGLLGDAVDQHQSLAAGTGAEQFIRPGDYVFIYAQRADYEAESHGWALKRAQGFEIVEMEPAALAAYDPALEGRAGFAVRCTGHGMISDPGAYIRALHEHFLETGGEALRAEARGVSLSKGRAAAIETDSGPIEADEIVITAGAWSGGLARTLGVTMPLESERGYHVEYLNPSITLRAPVMVAAGKFVATPMEGRLRCAGVVEFGGLEAGPSEAPFRMIEARVREVFPDLKHDETRRWMGHRPATADSLPVIGRAPAAANVWLGYGHQHVGLTGGPKTGRWLAQMIMGERPNADLDAFAPGRGAIVKT
ncbi:MAG: NAD(P)/FAD-dependent oxidoreductase [Pikeienuella sp.]